MSQNIYWRDVAPQEEAFHATRDVKTRHNSSRYHGHDFAELFWVEMGCAVHHVNRADFPLSPGSLVLVRPGDFHAIEPQAGQTIQLTNIAFSRATCDFLKRRYFPSECWAFWTRDPYPETRRVEPGQLARFNRWADVLSRSPRESLSIDRFLLDLLGELRPKTAEALPDETPDWLASACREIQKPENLSHGVERFFRLAARSREHVARSTRRCLGVSPTEYVNRLKMHYAARQLEMSSQGILDIALDCGIPNLSHFYTLFRSAFGMTPRAYRLSHRKTL